MNDLDLFRYSGEVRDKDDLTHLVERVEELEALTWLTISGVNAYRSSMPGIGHVDVRIMAQISSTIGHVLPGPVCIQAIAYSGRGQVIGIASERLYPAGYRGLHALAMIIQCRGEPERIRLFPGH